MNKNIQIIIAVIAVLIVGGAIYAGSSSSKSDQKLVTSPEVVDMGEWKTYSNEEYGFSFRYPSNLFVNKGNYGEGWWFVTQEENAPVFGFEDPCGTSKAYINVIVSNESTENARTNEEVIATVEYNFKNARGGKVSDTINGGQRIIVFEAPGQHEPLTMVIKGESRADISLNRCAGGTVPFKDIASSFKFTSPKTGNNPVASIDTTNWKTQVNTNLGYSISYPETYHVAFENSLVNYDETKYEKGNSSGVKIQIQKTSGNPGASKADVATVKFSERITDGPGGTFDVYSVTGLNGTKYFQILVWGRENDSNVVSKILSTFHFTSSATPGTCSNGATNYPRCNADLPMIPSITVLSPNGGEIWKIGSTQVIKWDLKGVIPAGYRLGLYLGNGSITNVDAQTSSGQYSYVVPESIFQGDMGVKLEPGKYKVTARLFDGPINQGMGSPDVKWGRVVVEDSSNAEITITN